MYRVLVTDDEITVMKGIQFHLQESNRYIVHTASDKPTALNLLDTNEFDLLVSDLMFPEVEDGLEVIRMAKKQWYTPAVLAMSAFDTVENAVATMQAGADDFVSKGFGVEELSIRIENLLQKSAALRKLEVENQILKETIQHQFSNFQIIGQSRQMEHLLRKIHKLASDARATCLIQGESGTGKDLVARTIHRLSERKNAPFVPINCAAIPENLIESELFGHERGAFTGAYTAKQGKFEQANGGVVFLDEISELPTHMQVRLLRVLEERNFYRLGGKSPIEVDVMILAASNRDLEKQVLNQKFREDLFFRLNVIKIWIPPLRDRREDILPLAKFFLDKFNQERNKKVLFSRESLAVLEQYDFPGNVRELRNIIEDAFVFCDGNVIRPENLFTVKGAAMRDAKVPGDTTTVQKSLYELPFNEAKKEFERRYLTKVLDRGRWNIKRAAELAGISREWIGKKAKQYGLMKAR